jgi:hypothetical protein
MKTHFDKSPQQGVAAFLIQRVAVSGNPKKGELSSGAVCPDAIDDVIPVTEDRGFVRTRHNEKQGLYKRSSAGLRLKDRPHLHSVINAHLAGSRQASIYLREKLTQRDARLVELYVSIGTSATQGIKNKGSPTSSQAIISVIARGSARVVSSERSEVTRR